MCENDKSSEKCDTSSAAGEPSKYLHMSFRQEWWMVLEERVLFKMNKLATQRYKLFLKKMDIYILFMYPSTDAINQEIKINSTSSCSLKLQVVSEGGIWAKLWLTHSVRAHFGSPESYHTSFIYFI